MRKQLRTYGSHKCVPFPLRFFRGWGLLVAAYLAHVYHVSAAAASAAATATHACVPHMCMYSVWLCGHNFRNAAVSARSVAPTLLAGRTVRVQVRACVSYETLTAMNKSVKTHTPVTKVYAHPANRKSSPKRTMRCDKTATRSKLHIHKHPSCHLPTGTETLTAMNKSVKTHTPVTKVYAHPVGRKSSPKRTMRCDKTATRYDWMEWQTNARCAITPRLLRDDSAILSYKK